MATCLSQLYHEHKRGINAGYAKFETFPIWNLPLRHPVNIAYEAATADLDDVNMIDPFHLEAYGQTTVNYNRDVEIFPVLSALFEAISGECPYKSPTDMGVNMAGYAITDDEACKEASCQEILRRYYATAVSVKKGDAPKEELYKQELLLKQAGIVPEDRKVAVAAMERQTESETPAAAIQLPDGQIVTGRTNPLLGAAASCLLNAIKQLAGIPHEVKLMSEETLLPIQNLKTQYMGAHNPDFIQMRCSLRFQARHLQTLLQSLHLTSCPDSEERRLIQALFSQESMRMFTESSVSDLHALPSTKQVKISFNFL